MDSLSSIKAINEAAWQRAMDKKRAGVATKKAAAAKRAAKAQKKSPPGGLVGSFFV